MKISDETLEYLAEFYLNDSDYYESMAFVQFVEAWMRDNKNNRA